MKKELTIFDKSKNVRRLLFFFYVVLVFLLIFDFFVIHEHAAFPWESKTNFFAVYGFVACVTLAFFARLLRFFLGRKEDYYENG